MKKIILLPVLLFFIHLSVVQAAGEEEKGLAIAQEADRRNQGYGDTFAHQTMTLIDEDGGENLREMDIKMLEVTTPSEGDKSLVTFSKPRDVQGTTLLTYSHVTVPDEQWLFLPALKRTKRISSSNKTGAFMGSEFAYEDMIPKDIDKYSYRFIREENCGQLVCFVVESYPKYEDSGYQRLLVWIDKAEYRMQKVEFYDRTNQLLKTLTLSSYQQYLGKYWRPDVLFMANHQNHKSTRMGFKGYQFRNGFHEQDFAQANLQRE